MIKLFRIFIPIFFFTPKSFSQNKIGEFEIANDFSRGNQAAGYYLKEKGYYQANLQTGDKIIRNRYDSNFKLIDSYEYLTQDYSLNQDFINTPIFAMNLQLKNDNYEIYADKKTLLVIAPDFTQKKDIVIFSQNLKNNERGEKRVAVLPNSDGLNILCYSNKHDKLYLYQWHENARIDTTEFILPKSSLSSDEIKKYTKSARVKYNAAFDDIVVSEANKPSVVGIAGSNYLYYTENRIWLVSQTPFYTGFNILELDIGKGSIISSNYFINDMRKNVEAKNELIKKPYALIWEDYLIIRNSSYKTFEYEFYDMKTKQLIKRYSDNNGDSLDKIIHSDYNQKGTWISGKEEKKLSNENAFLRKIGAGDGLIFLSKIDDDSITITTGSIKSIEGLTGSLVKLASIYVASALNLVIGPIQIIPYLQIYRSKLSYSHSRFSNNSFNLSTSKQITTTLDDLLDSFEKRDLKSRSSMLFKKGVQYIVAVYNPDSKKFELYTL